MSTRPLPAIVFVMSTPTGHVNGSFGLAVRLRAAGYRVIYLGPKALEPVVRGQQFEFRSAAFLEAITVPYGIHRRPSLTLSGARAWLSTIASNIVEARKETRNLLRRMPDSARDVEELVRDVQPSLLIFDPFVLIFFVLFYKHGVPAAALSTKSLLDPDPWVPPYTMPFIPTQSFWSEVRVRIAWLQCKTRYKLWEFYERMVSGYSLRGLVRRMARECSFPIDDEWTTRPVLFDMRFRSVPELVLHAQKLDFPRRKPISSHALYVGPNVYERRHDDEFPWHSIRRHNKLILCSLSTVSHPQSGSS